MELLHIGLIKRVQNGQGHKYKWVRELIQIIEESVGPEEFLENTKLEMYNDQVFVLHQGNLIILPKVLMQLIFLILFILK